MNNVISTIKSYVFNQKNNLIFALLCCLMMFSQPCKAQGLLEILRHIMYDEMFPEDQARFIASADLNRLGYVGPSYNGYDTQKDNLLSGNIGVRIPVWAYRESIRRQNGGSADYPNTSEVFIPNKFEVNNLTVWTGIEIIGKGGKTTFSSPTEIDVARLTYLQIPVYVIYKHKLPNKSTLYGGLGPYFAYALGGNVNITLANKSTDYVAFDKNGANYHPFDAGLGILGGYKLESGWSFELEYQLGLTNIDGKQFFDDKVVNRVLSLNVGYPISKILGAVKPKKKK